MRPKSEMLPLVVKWSESERTGNLVIYQPPKSELFDCFLEETIKIREMSETQQSITHAMFDAFEAKKIEMFRDKQGNPDRIKVTRGF